MGPWTVFTNSFSDKLTQAWCQVARQCFNVFTGWLSISGSLPTYFAILFLFSTFIFMCTSDNFSGASCWTSRSHNPVPSCQSAVHKNPRAHKAPYHESSTSVLFCHGFALSDLGKAKMNPWFPKTGRVCSSNILLERFKISFSHRNWFLLHSCVLQKCYWDLQDCYPAPLFIHLLSTLPLGIQVK